MNKKLQNILEIIKQSEKMDAEQKENLIKAVKDADKELEITEFKLERTEKVKKTTAILLEETIEELEQKRKAVEEQNRELGIEASLERVRAVAMGMDKSEDLLKICEVSFKEFKKLGFDNLRNAIIHVLNDEKRFFMDYDFSDDLGGAINKINYEAHPILESYLKQIKKADDAFAEIVIEGSELGSWKDFRRRGGQQDDPKLENIPALYYYLYSIGVGDIGISTFQPIKESQIKILKRFRNVFDLAYRRYNDIALAEAQAREAQIEAALERVRSRSIAMRKSEEIAEIAAKIFGELRQLDLALNRVLIWTFNDNEKYTTWWSANPEVESTAESYRIDYNENPVFINYLQAWQQRKPIHLFTLSGDTKKTWEDHLFEHTEMSRLPMEVRKGMRSEGTLYTVSVISDYGLMMSGSFEPLSEASIDIIQRFGRVFQQSYTRYLDVQKAEAQTREAQIEAALERVRAKAMAMHSSKDLTETIGVFYRELKSLGVIPRRCGVALVEKETRLAEVSTMNTTEEGNSVEVIGKIKMTGHPLLENIFEHWILQKEYHTVLSGNQIKEYYQVLKPQISYPDYPHDAVQFGYYFMFKEGDVYAWTEKELIEEELKIFRRFTTVISLTYKRYIDLQKAESQAREAEIQLALERVRARTMAMHNSNELDSVGSVLFHQLQQLNIPALRRCLIGIVDEVQGTLQSWYTSMKGDSSHKIITYPISGQPVIESKIKGWREQRQFSIELSGKKMEDFLKYTMSHGFELQSGEVAATHMIQNHAPFKYGYLEVATHEPISEKDYELLQRFARVFEQTYTRFLDLQKAEAQAREAQIETALEKVRSRSLAMHKSDELKDVVTVLFEQLRVLNLTMDTANIEIYQNDFRNFEMWVANSDFTYPEPFDYVYFDDLVNNEIIYHKELAQTNGEETFTRVYPFEIKNKFWNYLFEHTMFGKLPDDRKNLILNANAWSVSCVYSRHSGIVLMNYNDTLHSKEELNILRRFSRVFEQAYIRFLDLQKAEEQAHEAQIEAALDRVRARTMAMQHSNELLETATICFKQLSGLGIETERLYIGIFNDSGTMEAWGTSDYGPASSKFLLDSRRNFSVQKMYNGWKEQKKSVIINMQGKELSDYIRYLSEEVKVPVITGYSQQKRVLSIAYFSKGLIGLASPDPQSNENISMLERFAKVFDQTYTRFLDLQKAEAQAREAQIEASLERVRSKAMSMHSSEDLSSTVNAFFKELKLLNIIPIRCGVGQIDGETRLVDLTVTTATEQGDDLKMVGKLKLAGHPILDTIFEKWKNQQEYYPVLRGNEISDYYKVMNPQIAYPDFSNEEVQYGYYFHFKEGGVFAWAEKKFSDDDLNIFRKFTTVLSLTFRRYLDLKVTEARAAEAVNQASLDRVRAEIASMRTSEDLNRITPVIWRELKALEVPFIRCGVFIVNEEEVKTHVYLSTPDGKALGVLNLSFDANELTSNTVEHWRKKLVYKEHWNKEEFISWTKSMMELGQVQNAETYQGSSTPPESLHLHFVPFTQGMLYVGDVNPLTDEKLDLVKTLAEAFSIAYARYEDFKNIEEAKNKIELTLNELKSAQAQLVHSEKMASLGELTAGIAHEIKNPLNFVNNFSEISDELLDEIKEELEKNDKEEVLSILEDLKQNLKKINQHGKRADSIVKGMLLHSRGTAGEKVLTDINDLLDQYVNLAYHGMRATNKEFNITIEKDYDKSIEKINVVPQDISRVFLNIINNACYAAYDKKKKSNDNEFSPTLKVSTKNLNGKVEIRIGDNGNGIPKNILDKIFQPFFTTKPTGEGTGLGLSLSYDIVTKVHGGKLKVETKEDKGTNFIILLSK